MERFRFKKNILLVTISTFISSLLFMGFTIRSVDGENKIRNSYFSPPPSGKPLIGLYACNPGMDDTFPVNSPSLTTDYYWGSPIIDGVVERMSWAALEPTKNVLSFTKLDVECKRALSNGKGITLDIYGGINAPSWLFKSPYILDSDFKIFFDSEAVGTVYCDTSPIPWSHNYIANFDTFITKLGHHLSVTTYYHGGHLDTLINAIKVLKIGTCCTIFTSELRVPNQSCSGGMSEPHCCPCSDSSKWVHFTRYRVANLTNSIDTMADHCAKSFSKSIIAIPVIAGGRAFPAPPGCTTSNPVSDCITPGVFSHVLFTITDTNRLMGMYESLNIGGSDGSICKMLTGTTPGIIMNDHCLLGYQLNANDYGGQLSDTIHCDNLQNALNNGLNNEKAVYFEVFEIDFKNGSTGCESTTLGFYDDLHGL